MFEYGITTSAAFIWAHVCPLDLSIYWYQRSKMLEILGWHNRVEIPSARGVLIPIRQHLMLKTSKRSGFIHECELGPEFFHQWDWSGASNDREVGAFAEQCFSEAVRQRLLLLPVALKKVSSVEEQFKGQDFECKANYAIEVKADIRGGIWGTGNLFVQTHEQGHRSLGRNEHLRGGLEIDWGAAAP